MYKNTGIMPPFKQRFNDSTLGPSVKKGGAKILLTYNKIYLIFYY